MKLSTAIWHIKHGKPITDPALRDATISALRGSDCYQKDVPKKLFEVIQKDTSEKLSPKLERYAEKYRRSPNQSGSIHPKFIVLHHSAGSFLGSVSWILDPTSDVSYHYVINPDDGNRVQHVWDSKEAWHAGRSAWEGYVGLNNHSIGIAFAGDTNKRTPADYEIDSCARKCIYLMDKFDLGTDSIITHQQIAPGRKNDVSRESHELVLNRVNQLL